MPDAAGRHARGAHGTVQVSVVYAECGNAWQTKLAVPEGTDVGTVFRLSGFAEAFPDYPSEAPAVGIFGRRCHLEEPVAEGDRIEIYRPLDFDPMESRRRRAEHRKAAGRQPQFRPRRVRDAGNS
ncbi:RnfH family protein [Pusillimonas noertemannii]|uniref:RnfH family protein n=1 Tax=Pusillimonas noertemannii TaxID=305977 RepID=UPI001FAFECE9|nr:RnfH family protein [Pusillimonas noertemannii]